MTRRAYFGSLLMLSLAAAGCQDQLTDSAPTQLGTSSFSLQSDEFDVVSRNGAALPAGVRVSDQLVSNLGAINPSDYVCPASTPVSDWWLNEVYAFIGAEPAIFNHLYNQRAADLVVMYEALLFGTAATPQYFGYNGEHTKAMVKVERDIKNFWDIPSDNIEVIGMHGNMLQDTIRVARTYQAVFGLPAATARSFARSVRTNVLASTVLNGGDHALFSFNAFAISTCEGTSVKALMTELE